MIRFMVANFALLTAFLFLFNHLLSTRLLEKHRTLPFQLLVGVLHGCCALLLLLFSYKLNESTYLDFRHILVISSAYFGGLPASIATALFLAFGRTVMLGEFSATSVLALVSIGMAGVGSGLIMRYVKHYWHSWLLSLLNSMAIITILSFIRGITWDTVSYLLLVCLGGLFTATLISFFTSSNRLSAELERSERRYRSLHALQEAIFQSGAGVAVTVMDCGGRITHINKAAETMLGYSAEELIDGESPLIYHDSNEIRAYGEALFARTGKKAEGLDVLLRSAVEDGAEGREWTYVRKDGVALTVWLTLSPLLLDGRTAGCVGIATDISERKKMEEKLKQLSMLDGLTGIANRRFFDETLMQEWSKAKASSTENNYGVSLILFDIDHFKAYNDMYGHLAGDECLRKVSAIARTMSERHQATIARYGGEEFAVILSGAPVGRAAQLAEELRHAVESCGIPHLGAKSGQVITISVGASDMRPEAGASPDELIAEADTALYYSKGHGRNRVTDYYTMRAAAMGDLSSL